MLFMKIKEHQPRNKFRYEFKYEVDIQQIIIIKERLSRMLKKDVKEGCSCW